MTAPDKREKRISVNAPGKINLSIDVLGKRPDGLHEVDMVMQAVDFWDTVTVTASGGAADGPAENCQAEGCPAEGCPAESCPVKIRITCDVPGLPTDRSNICYAAAELMSGRLGRRGGEIRIDIQKRIPVAAGMAGGSTDGAAVLHALNALWDGGLSVGEIMELGGKLGADVPFCALAQSGQKAARARGTGRDISPAEPLVGYATFARPDLGVSTKEVYKGIDSCDIASRPDNDKLVSALAAGDRKAAAAQMINVLEEYTLRAEPRVAELKALMESELPRAEKVLMSGSGPTVFAIFGELKDAEQAAELLTERGYEAHACAL